MADEAAEINTAAQDGEEKRAEREVWEVSAHRKDVDDDDIDERVRHDADDGAVAESTWTAPILSLARKATETIGYGASFLLLHLLLLSSAHPRVSDDDLPGRSTPRHQSFHGFWPAKSPPLSLERSNLLSMMKLSIKVLIQSSLSLGQDSGLGVPAPAAVLCCSGRAV
ncbi:hypothetical protein CRUP_007962 [Coryphaenoides rupestris]|nr:hypothetical protein CRUP_007962 [Coryphaenoides rupestris]